jgi:general secretion pathway protein F
MYRFWVIALLTFVFPGYYWIHRQRSFDARLQRLTAMLQSGASLNLALRLTPGVVSQEAALAVTVGQFSGNLPEALHRLPDRRLKMQWLEMLPRFGYPIVLITFMMGIVSFIMVFIIPKFEKIFMDFRMRLPASTDLLIAISRAFVRHWYVLALAWLIIGGIFVLLLLSSRARWYFPLLGGLYRGYARGQFLHTLGMMLQTGRPLPQILGAVLESGLLPTAVANRVDRLLEDLRNGQPLADSLVANGLATRHMHGLITTAEKANNLSWALEQMGDSLCRRSARNAYRFAMVVFPLCILACAALIGVVAVAMFSPLTEMLDKLSEMR